MNAYSSRRRNTVSCLALIGMESEELKLGTFSESESDATLTIQLDNDTDELDLFVLPPPVAPELPDLRGDLGQLNGEIADRIARHLDTDSSIIVKNWEWLAHHLGKDSVWIKNIRDRARLSSSPTLSLIQAFSRVSQSEFFYIIKQKLQRYDVLLDIIPRLKSHSQVLPSTSRNDSGINTTATSDLTVFGVSMHNPVKDERLRILLCFYDDRKNKDLRKYVKWLEQELVHLGAIVERLGLTFFRRIASDLPRALNTVFNCADQIIVIPSVEYKRIVDGGGEGDMELDQRLSSHLRYVHDQICAEYMQEGCRNRRVSLVALGAQTGFNPEFIPNILKTTLIYHWPNEHTALVKSLFNHTTSSLPTLQSAPSISSLTSRDTLNSEELRS